jgi:hypothetical protein
MSRPLRRDSGCSQSEQIRPWFSVLRTIFWPHPERSQWFLSTVGNAEQVHEKIMNSWTPLTRAKRKSGGAWGLVPGAETYPIRQRTRSASADRLQRFGEPRTAFVDPPRQLHSTSLAPGKAVGVRALRGPLGSLKRVHTFAGSAEKN